MAKPIREKSHDFLYHLIKDVKKAHTHGIQDLPSVAVPPVASSIVANIVVLLQHCIKTKARQDGSGGPAYQPV